MTVAAKIIMIKPMVDIYGERITFNHAIMTGEINANNKRHPNTINIFL